MQETSKRRRIESLRDSRFLTFSCYRRLPLLQSDWARDIAVEQLALTHDRLGFHLYSWVVMLNHVHLLIWPDIEIADVRRIMSAYKTRVSKRVLDHMRAENDPLLTDARTPQGEFRLWQHGGGHDRNIWSKEEFFEKARYLEENPVRAGLADCPEDYRWSSAGSEIIGRDEW